MATNFNTVVTSSASNSQITTEGNTSLITKGYFSTWTDAFSTGTISVADDSFAFIDAGDSSVKLTTIASFVSAIAGSGLTATNGQLSASGGGGGSGDITAVTTGNTSGLNGGAESGAVDLVLAIDRLNTLEFISKTDDQIAIYDASAATTSTKKIAVDDFMSQIGLGDLSGVSPAVNSTSAARVLAYDTTFGQWSPQSNLFSVKARNNSSVTATTIGVTFNSSPLTLEGDDDVSIGIDFGTLTWGLNAPSGATNLPSSGNTTQVTNANLTIDSKGRILTATSGTGGSGGGSPDSSTNSTSLDLSNTAGTYYTNSANTSAGPYTIATSPAAVAGGFAYVRILTASNAVAFPSVTGATRVASSAPFAAGASFFMIVRATPNQAASLGYYIEYFFVEY